MWIGVHTRGYKCVCEWMSGNTCEYLDILGNMCRSEWEHLGVCE